MAAASAALADTYVRVEKDGTKTYSDRPIPGGKPVVLESAQTYTSTPVMSDSSQTLEQQSLATAANFRYATCSISPANDATFHNPESVTVSMVSEPPIRAGDLVNFTLDGSRLGVGQASVAVPLPDRGSHTVNAQILDSSGREMCSTRSTFHVQRTNLNSQQRQALPQPRPRPPRPTPH